MVSLQETEDEILKILTVASSPFEGVVSEIRKARRKGNVSVGSRSTISQALKSLYRKRFVEYDVETRQWRVTSLGQWIVGGFTPTESSLALSQLTQPMVDHVLKNPGDLVDRIAKLFLFTLTRKDEPTSRSLLKQIKAQLNLVSEDNLEAIAKIWIDGVEFLVGQFSGLLAAIILYRASTLQVTDKSLHSVTIQRIVDQWFRAVSIELGTFLTAYLADLKDLANLESTSTRHGAELRGQFRKKAPAQRN